MAKCPMCQRTDEEWIEFNEWSLGFSESRFEGIRYFIRNKTLYMAAVYDSGYLGDKIGVDIVFCPKCGRKL